MAVLRLVALLLALVIVGGCNSSKTAKNRSPHAEPWFCEMNERGDDWDCVQDEALARAPAPKRLPSPDGPPAARKASATLPSLPTEPAEPTPDPTADATGPAPMEASEAAEVNGLASSDTIIDAVVDNTLSQHPEMLLELPEDYFVVQLVAMSKASQIDDYVAAHDLQDAASVLIGSNEKLMHVLVLGVYRTYAQAQQAILERPDSLADAKPWIRPLGSLQQAMLAADALAAGVD